MMNWASVFGLLESAVRSVNLSGRHLVVVPHSQGNLLLGNAMGLYNRFHGVPVKSTGCAGAVSLASPMTQDKFSIGSDYLRGRTIQNVDDILLQAFLPNDFSPRERSQLARAGADTLAMNPEYENAVKRKLRRIEIGQAVHAVDENYFRDPYVTPVIQGLCRQVYDECHPQ